MKSAAINKAFYFLPRKNCAVGNLWLFVERMADAMKTMLYCLLLLIFCFTSASSYANNPPQGRLVASFSYNAEGLRIEKRGERGIERYTYDDQSVLSERDGSNALVARYTYGPNRLISLKHKTEGTQFYLTDALNSIVNLMTTDGLVQARYQYDAFGNKRSESGISWNRFAFTGYEEDKETNLLYAKARYYDADTGRFLSQDAWHGENNTPPSLHKYLYAYQNPTVYLDPTGNFPVTDWLKQSADQSTAIQGDMMNSLGGKLGDSFVKDLGVRSMAMGLAAVTKATEAVGSVAGVADASIDASIGSVYGGDVLGQNSRDRTVDRIEGAANGVNAAYQFSQRDDAMRVTGQAISAGASNYAEKVRSGDLKTTSNLGVGLGGFAMGGYLASGAKAMTIAGESADAIGSAVPLDSKVLQQAKNSIVENVANKQLLPGEGQVASYRVLKAAGVKGDNITPHHIPSANHMAKHGVSKGDGISINMEQPSPGVGGRHRQTFTYGTKADNEMAPRDALAAGVRDARRIYQQDGLYDGYIRQQLQELVQQNKAAHPTIFRKAE